jgi:hypothetical protein
MAENVSENELSSLTENQQAVLKVLADADGETLRGKEVRQRLNEDYGVELNRQGMNAVRRKNSRYPNQMTEAHFRTTDEEDVDTQHSTHRLKDEYIESVRRQLF